MTYEELIVAIDAAADTLPRSGLRLLIRLVSLGIQQRTCEITVTHRELAEQLGISKDNVALAIRELKHVMKIQSTKNSSTTFLMPEDWFAPQLSLFAVQSTPKNQDTVSRKPGHWWARNQDTTDLETRTPWSENQDTVGEKPGQRPGIQDTVGEEPGHGVPISRTAITKNQRLSASPSIDRSTEGIRAFSGSEIPVHSIGTATSIPPEREPEVKHLVRWLRDYLTVNHPSHNAPNGPDRAIVARCLAIAPLKAIGAELAEMEKKRIKPGDGWAWFVTVLCDRLRGQKPGAVAAPPGFHESKRQPQSQMTPDFAGELTNQIRAGARSLR